LGRSKPELPLKNMNVTFNISSDTIKMMQTRLTRVPQPGGFATYGSTGRQALTMLTPASRFYS